jgi:NADH-ubiquinone oxidoreductase chain 4L
MAWINLMKNFIMGFSIFLFLIGMLGFVLNRKNIILMLISIEIMLLSITFLILISSLSFDDILGQIFAIYIITVAGAESAIGLGILVAFYRFTSLKLDHLSFSHNYLLIILVNKIPVSPIKIGVRNYSTTNCLKFIDP